MTAPNPLQALGIPARDEDLIALDAREWEPIEWGKQRGFRFTINYAGTPCHVSLFSFGQGWFLGVYFGAIAGPRVGAPAAGDRPSTATDVAFTFHSLAAGSREHASVVGEHRYRFISDPAHCGLEVPEHLDPVHRNRGRNPREEEEKS